MDNRYDHDAFKSELAVERAWLLHVANVLDQRIEAAKGLDKYRVNRLKPKAFHKVQDEDNVDKSIAK